MKQENSTFKRLFLILTYLMITCTLAAQVTIVPFGSSWRYMDNGSDQGILWRLLPFSDLNWKTGNGMFGFGTKGLSTAISFGGDKKNKHITTYFRKSINIAHPSIYQYYSAKVKRGDDGVVVYVNGVEVFRNNMPSEVINYRTQGANKNKDKDKDKKDKDDDDDDGDDDDDDDDRDNEGNGNKVQAFTIKSSAFKAGTNVIAVEVHLKRENSPAMSFDLELLGYPGQTTPSDVTSPVVKSIHRQSPSTQTTTAGTLVYRTMFSEKVSGVDVADFNTSTVSGTVSGVVNSVSAVGTQGTIYDVTVNSITGAGTIRLDMKSSGTGIKDAAGNAISGGFTTGESYIITPKTVPTLTSVGITSNNSNTSLAKVGDVVTLSFTASEPINTPTVTIASHSVTPVAGSGNSYTATYTMTAADAAGVVPFSISFTSTAGTAGIPVNATTNSSSVTFDKTAPTVTSINRQSPTTETTTATVLTFRATFSEKVSGVDAADFAVTAVSGNVSGAISGVTTVGTEGTTYDVTVSSITGSGVARLDLKSSGTGVIDVSGNTIGGGFSTGQTYSITLAGDVTAPTVVSINRYNPTTQNTTATSLVFRTTFSEAVTGVDVTDFVLTKTNTATGTISSVSGSGTIYDITVNGISGSGSLRLDIKSSGTGITDVSGNAITSGYTTGQTYIFEQQTLPYGFTSVTPLSSLPITDVTKDKPQAKAWKYAGKWWCVLATAGGVKIYRLDGTSWTSTLVVAPTTNARADCRVVGDLVHILLYKGASQNSFLATVQYDATLGTYKMWGGRSSNVTKVFPAGSETATLVVDSKGRMWTASDGVDQIVVRWSDAPYTNWSDPIVIASGIKDDDICTITALPGKIGVFWSNQNTKMFGFRTHTDGADPASWSADELPASQSALSIKAGMADDHMNIAVASDGTMYCAVKTGYNTDGYPAVSLLVRRPSGTWDGLYPVTLGGGTQPMVVLNEAKGKVKVVYTTVENGGEIVYRESLTSGISFGAPLTLISGGGYLYNYATSTHQTYDPEVVIIASNVSTNPWQAVSVLASDGPLPAASSQPVTNQNTGTQAGEISASPNPFSTNTTLSFTLVEASEYTIGLYDINGALLHLLKKGSAEAGVLNTVDVSAAGLIDGIYMVKLQTSRGTMLTYKLVLKR